MWIPKNEDEILAAVAAAALEETATFEGKRELPAKSAEIAKDIAAMATDGGVILYGLGEDENQRLTVMNPISLPGQSERISQISQTAIAEPPRLEVRTIPTAADPSKGYILVVVPQSERAPHMVIIKGEHRYYGRGTKGNVPLSEGDVARLYERRRRWDIDRDVLLASEIAHAPFHSQPGVGYLFVIARPVTHGADLLARAIKPEQTKQGLLSQLVRHIEDEPGITRDYAPRFMVPAQWVMQPEGFWGEMSSARRALGAEDPSSALHLQIDHDGTGHLFFGRAADQETEAFYFFPTLVAGNTVDFFSLLGHLFDRAGYVGMVDIGLAITGIRGAVPYLGRKSQLRGPEGRRFDRDEFRTTGRFSAMTLKNAPLEPASQLLTPLFDAISQGQLRVF